MMFSLTPSDVRLCRICRPKVMLVYLLYTLRMCTGGSALGVDVFLLALSDVRFCRAYSQKVLYSTPDFKRILALRSCSPHTHSIGIHV